MVDKNFYKYKGPLTLEGILKITDGEIRDSSDLSQEVTDLTTSFGGGGQSIAYAAHEKFVQEINQSKPFACVVSKSMAEKISKDIVTIIVDSPYRAFSKIAKSLFPDAEQLESFEETSDNASFKGCQIAKSAVIGKGVVIGEGTSIGPHVALGPGVQIGKNCVIYQGSTLTHSIVKDNVKIHSGARIGQTGFGFEMDQNGPIDMPHLGRVLLEEGVSIGANTTIDRGTLSDTVIGSHSRVDNLVQIGHNVKIGSFCIIVSQVGVSGSTKLGNFVVLGGQAGLADNLNIGDNVQVAAKSGVMSHLKPGVYSGYPAVPIKEWRRQMVAIRSLGKKGKN